MAYTYDDFVTAANKAGKMGSFTQEDLNIARISPEYGLGMLRLQQDYDGATTREQRLLAQEGQKQLRGTYGTQYGAASSPTSFPGGTGGNGTQTSFTPNQAAAAATPAAPEASTPTAEKTGTTGSYTYGRQDELDKLIQQVTNPDPFSYDPATDPSYVAARKQYLREAERAREDTMAKAGAATGGTPSSFAVTAAQQAGDYHLTQFADRAAGLEQTAYQRYLNELQQKAANISVLTGERDFDYAAYLEQLAQDQQKVQNAMSLYETYKDTMSIEQMRKLFESMGYLTPAVEVFLTNMANPVNAYVPETGTGGRGKNKTNTTTNNKGGSELPGVFNNVGFGELIGFAGDGGVDHTTNWRDKVNKTDRHGVTR